PTYFDYGSIYGTVNGTIAGNTLVAGSSESSKSKRDREKSFERQSSNLFLRKSEIEQDISNETGNEKGEVDHELQDSDLDTADNEEAIDDQGE
ncbi:14468_t:CDS:2, partial [Acaulospora morrowiae]